jgi:GNAT superfamily N-acetyltransferase
MISAVDDATVVGTVAVGGGRLATIHRSRAPLPRGHGMAVAWFLEGAFGAEDKPDVFVTVAAKGLTEDVARNDFAWAEVAGEVVATAWTLSPADEPRLATMGEVYTDPAWRGFGLAPALCTALIQRFDAAGGRVLFLGTGNPSAARIYHALGFRPHPRGFMRRDTAGEPAAFDEEWFEHSAVTVRPVSWGDTPRLVALYNAPNPWLSACWMQGLYSPTYVTHDRCNSLVKNTWQATRPGAWLAMVNGQGALVGSGPMEPSGNEKAVRGALVDVFVHPEFHDQAPVLLAAMTAEARARDWRWLRADLGSGDAAKRTLLETAGFREVARLPAAIEIGGLPQDAHILRLDL